MFQQKDPVEQFVTINDGNYCYRKIGQGPEILLLHGITDSSRFFWRNFYDCFQDKYTIIALDLKGHGLSDKPKRGYTVFDHAQIVANFMDQLGLKKVNLLGHSLGGMIATKFSLLYPEKVSNLIIYDSPLGGWTIKDLISLVSLPVSFPIGLSLLPLIGYLFYRLRSHKMMYQIVKRERLFYDPSLLADEIIEEKLKCSYEGFAYSFWNVIMFASLRRDLQYLRLPTLIIRGEFDSLVTPDQAERTAAMIPNSKLVIINKSSHFPLIEQPDIFNQAVSTFLNIDSKLITLI